MSALLSDPMTIPTRLLFYLRFLYRFVKAYIVAQFGLSNPPQNYSNVYSGLRAKLEIIRDEYGVAHVLADNNFDAFWGSGFVQSHDRLWQMESARRFAQGRLSEIAGDNALSTDRLMRQIGLYRIAQADVDLLEDEELELFEAYVLGVAAGVESLRTLPPEFHLLGLTFEPWTVTDVLLVARLLLFSFTGNWKTELIREELLKNVDSSLWPLLEPVHPDEWTATGDSYQPGGASASERLLKTYRDSEQWAPTSSGASNAWAVRGALSESDQPLLAGDPHVELRLPGLFHVSHIKGGDFNVIGGGLAGVPGVLIGHNEHVGWGVTAGMVDIADCVVETVTEETIGNTLSNIEYVTPDGPKKLMVFEEEILVRNPEGSRVVVEEIASSRHGPIVSTPNDSERRIIALNSTVFDPSPIGKTFIRMMKSESIGTLAAALSEWPGAPFNFVMADTRGDIGYQLAGKVMRHSAGGGLLPRDGSKSPGKLETYTSDQMPSSVNPPSNLIVSANQAIGGELELGEEWAEPRRAERITELLVGSSGHDVESFAEIQTDVYSANLVALRDLLLPVVDDIDRRRSLSEWDGQLNSRGDAASFISYVSNELSDLITESIAGLSGDLLQGKRDMFGENYNSFTTRHQGWLVNAVSDADKPWFHDVNHRKKVLRLAITRAERRIGRLGNKSISGEFSFIRPKHSLAAVPILGRIWSSRPVPFGGDINTISQGAFHRTTDGRDVSVTAGYRQILKIGRWDEAVFAIPTGISGIPGHSNYLDFTDEFAQGTYRPLLWSVDMIRTHQNDKISLHPR